MSRAHATRREVALRQSWIGALSALALSLFANVAWAEPAAPSEHQVLNVWPGVAPGSEHWRQREISATFPGPFPNPIVRNVTHPTLTVYLPDPARATGAAAIVAPGGGFLFLSIKSEGTDVAQWLADHGVAAFVLKYRTRETPVDQAAFMQSFMALIRPAPGQTNSTPLADAAQYGVADAVQALRVVRAHAVDWHIDAQRVGIVGFSAGARVAAGALLQTDPALRPSFAAPIYGGLFGEDIPIPQGLPPVFAAVAQDDPLALQSAVDFTRRLRMAGSMPELHLFNAGSHGFGLNPQHTTSDHWIDEFYWWLEANHFLQPRAGQ